MAAKNDPALARNPYDRKLEDAAKTGEHDTQARTEKGDGENEDPRLDDEEETDESLHERLVDDATAAGLSAREAGSRVSADEMDHKASLAELRRRRRQELVDDE